MTIPASLDCPPAAHAVAPPWYRRDLARVLTLGGVIEVALIVGLTWPLWIGRRPVSLTQDEPLAVMLGQNGAGLTRLVLTLAVWGVGFLLALHLCRAIRERGARIALYGLPLLFCLTLWPTLPAASKDAYHYVMEGRVLVVHGLNPLVTPPAAVPGDALYWVMSSWENEPSRYGPVWAMLAAVPPLVAGDSLTGSLLVLKAITIAALLATAWLTLRTVRRIEPARATFAWTLVAWNPLLIFESAANGHNDALMLALTALAVYLATRRRWTLAFPALALAALIKYVTGLLGPLLLLWAWRSHRRGDATRRELAIGLAGGAAITIASYAAFWHGWGTFRAVRSAANDALNSPGWLLREGMERVGVADGAAQAVMIVSLGSVFVLAYAWAARTVWRGRGELRYVWRAGLIVLAAYISTVAWWFWPWYVLWLVPLAAVRGGARAPWLIAAWSLAALAAYVPITYRLYFWGPIPDAHMPLFVSLTVFLPMLVAAVALAAGGTGTPRTPSRRQDRQG